MTNASRRRRRLPSPINLRFPSASLHADRPTDSREHQQRRNIVRREYSLEGDRLSGTSLVASDAAAAEIDAFGRRAG